VIEGEDAARTCWFADQLQFEDVLRFRAEELQAMSPPHALRGESLAISKPGNFMISAT